MSLRDLGFTTDQELVYRRLLACAAVDVETLVHETGLDVVVVAEAFEGLLALRVVRVDHRMPSGFTAFSPPAAIGELIERREDELTLAHRRVGHTRTDLAELEALWSNRPRERIDGDDIERIESLEHVRERLEELSFLNRTSVYSIQPGGPQTRERLDAARPLDQRGLRRRLDMRVIYETRALDDELNRTYLKDLVNGGARVRVTDHHIDRMIIMDEQVALVPIDPADSNRGALIVRHPALIPRFCELFRRAWDEAKDLPIDTDEVTTPTITELDRRVLELLASGCTDETSAHELGVSVRHLRRTISRLMQDLDASSRFEAGVAAARLGWI